MIPNVTRGKDFRGLLRYLLGPGRSNEHVRPHLVAADAVITGWAPAGVLTQVDGRMLADELSRPARMWGRGPKAGPVWHCSLSIKAEDGPLPDERWQAVAAGFIAKMGWAAEVNGLGVPWLGIHHGRSKAGNDHIHLVVSMVAEDGSLVDTHNDFARAQQACRELEAELNLTPVPGPALGLGSRGLTPAELNQQTDRQVEPARLTLELAVRAAATAAESEAEFVEALRAGGIRVAPYYAKGSSTEVTGYKVGLRGAGQRMFGGGKLSRDLTLPRLRLRWEDTEQSRAAALRAWQSTSRPAARRPVVVAPTASQIDEMNQQLAAMVQRIRLIPPGDVEAWGQIAADTAGVLAAWSRAAATPEQARQLAEAARASRQLGQLHRWAITGQRGRRPVTTGAARLAQQLAVGGQGPIAQAIFLRQLINTLAALRDAARANNQARIATAISMAVRRDLAQLVAAMPAIPEELMTAHQQAPTIAAAQAALSGGGLPAPPTRPGSRTTAEPNPDQHR